MIWIVLASLILWYVATYLLMPVMKRRFPDSPFDGDPNVRLWCWLLGPALPVALMWIFAVVIVVAEDLHAWAVSRKRFQ